MKNKGEKDSRAPTTGTPFLMQEFAQFGHPTSPDWLNARDDGRRCARHFSGIAMMALLGLLTSSQIYAQPPRQFSGVAAFYSIDYSGRTARGERYDPSKFTAAHRSLPFGTHLRVTDPRTHRSVVVVVNDRGPFTKGRVLDLSLAAAKALHMTGRGLMRVIAAIEPPAN